MQRRTDRTPRPPLAGRTRWHADMIFARSMELTCATMATPPRGMSTRGPRTRTLLLTIALASKRMLVISTRVAVTTKRSVTTGAALPVNTVPSPSVKTPIDLPASAPGGCESRRYAQGAERVGECEVAQAGLISVLCMHSHQRFTPDTLRWQVGGYAG